MDNFNLNTTIKENKIRKAISIPKIIFVILGIILLAEVVFAIKTLTSPTPSRSLSKSSIQIENKELYLSVPKTSYKVGEVIPVSVVVNTNSRKVSGADLMLNFDPKAIEATQGALVKGYFFDEYPVLSLDKNKGLIFISGVSNVKGGIDGMGQMATLLLRAKTSGKAFLTIAFNKGSTADSNLVLADTAEDILENVGNVEILIQ